MDLQNLFAQAQKVIPGGVNSPVRAFRAVGGTPIFIREATGSKIIDADGEALPAQDLYFVTLANGYKFAARGSGTEPKMKFYLFASEPVAGAAELPAVKARTRATLDGLIKLIEADARRRADS